MPDTESPFDREQEEAAAAEAARIGGRPSDEPPPEDDEALEDPAQRPLAEAGEGESEGFEEAERELIDHASHADEHAARRAIQDAPEPEPSEGEGRPSGGDPDYERSSERG